MQVVLHIVSGPAAGSRWLLRSGQSARIGRSGWADFSVPSDAAMADICFTLECGQRKCVFRDVQDPPLSRLNGQPVGEAALNHGDRIAVGKTVFQVTLEGVMPAGSGDSTGAGKQGAAAAGVERQPAAPIVPLASLSAEANEQLDPQLPAHDFLNQLLDEGLIVDALRFVAAWLPKPAAVAWAGQCVRFLCESGLKPIDQSALAAGEAWAAEPNEERRRQAETAAAATKYDGPAGWVAKAAFWAEGSVTPAGLPEVPPPPHLTATAVTSALLIAVGRNHPLKAGELYAWCLDAGRQRLAECFPEEGILESPSPV